jgi:hypothetical protein
MTINNYKYGLNTIECPILLNPCFFKLEVFIFCFIWQSVTFNQVVKKVILVNWTCQRRHVVLTSRACSQVGQRFGQNKQGLDGLKSHDL